MKIERFEDIDAWKEAREIVKFIYNIFHTNKDFGFKDQIQRASVSIMSNIAEGFDRGTNKEFIQFLVIARASVSEVKSLSYIALDVGYIDKEQFEKISAMCTKITSLLNGFIRYLRNSTRKY
ncbi:MAG: four helix bundle protein [Candidatus Dojkabacteria bacterium]